jgi:DNA ligase-4
MNLWLTPLVLSYRTLVRIGTGLSLGDYEWVNAKPWKPLDVNNLPEWLHCAPGGSDDKGDVYIEPEE